MILKCYYGIYIKLNNLCHVSEAVLNGSFSRPSVSPPRLGSRSNILRTNLHSQINQKALHSTLSEGNVNRSISSNAPKRTRSPPPLFSADETLEGNINSSDDNSER